MWRPLAAIVAAYAVAIQSLLVAVAGFALPADAGESTPAFELCLHDASDAPELPASKPDLSGCTHCIFCFAGGHDALIGTPPGAFHRVHVTAVVEPWLSETHSIRPPARHVIASPRGPPPGA